MTDSSAADAPPKSHLDDISTRWAIVHDPLKFVLRYAPAIQKYLQAVVGNAHDAEEIAQEFLLRMMERRFESVEPDGGRFRFYLKQAVRNAVRAHYRRRRPDSLSDEALAELTDFTTAEAAAEQEWLCEWRTCMLNRAFSALEVHERSAPGNLFYTVLRLTADYPNDDSATLTERVAQQTGRPLTVEAFRKQLSRARRMFAALLREEVAATLIDRSDDAIREELADLGLLGYVGAYSTTAVAQPGDDEN